MAIFGIGKKEVIYYPGCYSLAFLPDKVENYRRILKKIDSDFSTLRDFSCCGGILDECGYERDLRKLARQNMEMIAKTETKKIITSCPLCFYMLKQRYTELLPNWNIEIINILNEIYNKLSQDNNLIVNYTPEEIVYYDSCYLARYCSITDEPRKILRLIGYKLVELPKNREETLCCGNCGNLPAMNAELAERICSDFIMKLRKRKVKKIVTADPRAYKYLRDSLDKKGISDIMVLEISELICDALDISRE